MPDGTTSHYRDLDKHGEATPPGLSQELPRGILSIARFKSSRSLDNVPDEIKINSKVVMDKDVAEPCDVLPRNSGYCLSYLVANSLRRLPDQMKVANDRVLNDRLRMERVPTGSGVAFYPADAVEDVLQV